MKYVFTVLCCFPLLLNAQHSAPHTIRLGLFTPDGRIIDSTHNGYRVSFAPLPRRVSATAKNGRFVFNGYDLDNIQAEITETKTGRTMSVKTSASIDSLVFNPGIYVFNRYTAFLMNIRPVKAQLHGSAINHFLAGTKQPCPIFYMEEDPEEQHLESKDCYRMSAQMEMQHGGRNWITNVCNDIFQEYVHAEDTVVQARITAIEKSSGRNSRTSVYPWNHRAYIKHRFDLSAPYTHTISLSTDGCQTWTPLFVIPGDWYVYITFFPGSSSVGIDISNSGVMLLSTGDLFSWKAYTYDDWEDDPPRCRTKAMVFKNQGWMEDSFVHYYFSE